MVVVVVVVVEVVVLEVEDVVAGAKVVTGEPVTRELKRIGVEQVKTASHN
jgi:hypothetical protein